MNQEAQEKATFDFNDYLGPLNQMKKMGGISKYT